MMESPLTAVDKHGDGEWMKMTSEWMEWEWRPVKVVTGSCVPNLRSLASAHPFFCV